MNHLAFKCNFCILNFTNRCDRNEHIKQHYNRKQCGSCDRLLLQIGDEWYEIRLHVDEHCNNGQTKSEDKGYDDDYLNVIESPAFPCDTKDVKVETEEIREADYTTFEAFSQNDETFDSTLEVTADSDMKAMHLDISAIPAIDVDPAKPIKMKRHRKNKNKKMSIKCEHCDQILSYRTCYRRHLIRTHNIKLEFDCNRCNEHFNDWSAYQKHRKSHPHQKTVCTFCDKAFKSAFYCNRHIEREHEDNQVSCDICKRVFKHKEYLPHHMKMHINKEKHKCHICDKEFKEKVRLGNHIKIIHEGIQLFKCGVCCKGFSSDKALSNHQKVHAAVRSFICNFCGHGFNFKRNLDEHLRTHSDERPFLCKECGKGFKQVQVLRAHQLAHKSIKRYPCKVEGCNVAYANGTDLKRHRYNVHGECRNLINCPLCPEVFLENRLLKKHLELHNAY